MAQNPYLESGADDDLFESSGGISRPNQHKHTIDGSMCPTCGIVHNFELFKEAPPEVISSLLTFLDSMPDAVAKSLLDMGMADPAPSAMLATKFLSYSKEVDEHNVEGPLLRAIFEILDRQTDGELSRMWDIYDVERELIGSHTQLKSLNQFLDMSLDDENAPHDVRTMLQTLVQYMVARIEQLENDYYEACSGSDYEPLPSIIDSGTYPEGTPNAVKKLMIEALERALDD